MAVTLQTVADACGVSRNTVSLALRRHPSIPERTRTRIVAAAEELGYRPNPLVSALMAHLNAQEGVREGRVLAVIDFWPEGYPQDDIGMAPFLTGAVERARQQGFLPEIFPMAGEGALSPARLRTVLRTRAIHGVLFLPAPGLLIDVTSLLDWSFCSAATIGFTIAAPGLHRATPDHFHNARLAVEQLRKNGFRRIGLMVDPAVDRRIGGRWSGAYRVAVAELGLEPLVFTGEFRAPKVRKAWIDAVAPDALIGQSIDMIALLHRSGVRQAKGLGYADVAVDSRNAPGTAGVDQLPATVGAAAVDLVTAQLMRNERAKVPKHVMIPGEWREGTITGSRDGGSPRVRLAARSGAG